MTSKYYNQKCQDWELFLKRDGARPNSDRGKAHCAAIMNAAYNLLDDNPRYFNLVPPQPVEKVVNYHNYINQAALLERGWTKGTIAKELGNCHQTRRIYLHTIGHITEKLWLKSSVSRIEKRVKDKLDARLRIRAMDKCDFDLMAA